MISKSMKINSNNQLVLRIEKFKLIIFFLLFFLEKPLIAGIKDMTIAKWQPLNNEYYIDTNDFTISSDQLKFWVKNKEYKKRKLILDCRHLISRESFNNKFSPWVPILKDTPEYEIVNQLCFLTKVEGFTQERSFRQTDWVKRIIFINSKKEKDKLEKEKSNRVKQEEENKLKFKKMKFLFE